jgi:hypothetical protein
VFRVAGKKGDNMTPGREAYPLGADGLVPVMLKLSVIETKVDIYQRDNERRFQALEGNDKRNLLISACVSAAMVALAVVTKI